LLEIARKLRIAAIAAMALGISPKIANRGRCPVTTVARPATSPVSVLNKIRVAIVVVNQDTSVETVLRSKEIAQVRTRIGSPVDTVRNLFFRWSPARPIKERLEGFISVYRSPCLPPEVNPGHPSSYL